MFLGGDADLQLPPPPGSKQKWGDIFFDNFVPSCVGSQNSELQDDLLFIVKKVPTVEAGISSMEVTDRKISVCSDFNPLNNLLHIPDCSRCYTKRKYR